MSEKYDFSKPKDQKRFGKLPETEQKELIEKSHEEANEMNTENKTEKKLDSELVGSMDIIYRDNDLFQEYIPEIEKYFKSLNGNVRFTSFPKGTDENIIRDWYKQNRDNLAGKVLLTDNTCSPKYREVEASKASVKGGLDQILSQAFTDTLGDEIGKKNFAEKIDSLETYDQIFPKIFKMLFSKKELLPNEVHIIENYISAHIEHLTPDAEKDIEAGTKKETVIAKRFKKYIEDAGFPSGSIAIQNDILKEIDKKNNWILVDRHNRNLESVTEATTIDLPFGSFIQSVEKHGLIEFPKEKMIENIIPSLAYHFKKNPTLEDIKNYLDNHHGYNEPIYSNEFGESGLLSKMSDPNKAARIVEYYASLLFSEKKFNFDRVADALEAPVIQEGAANKIIREVIDKKGFDKISEYLKGGLLKKLDPIIFDDIINKEYTISEHGGTSIDGKPAHIYGKYRLEKESEGLTRIKISTIYKDYNGNILKEEQV